MKKNVIEDVNYCYNIKFCKAYSGHINAYCLPMKLNTSWLKMRFVERFQIILKYLQEVFLNAAGHDASKKTQKPR